MDQLLRTTPDEARDDEDAMNERREVPDSLDLAPLALQDQIPMPIPPNDLDTEEKSELANLIQYVAGKLVREVEVRLIATVHSVVDKSLEEKVTTLLTRDYHLNPLGVAVQYNLAPGTRRMRWKTKWFARKDYYPIILHL